MDRKDVYLLIDSERTYQNSLGSGRNDGTSRSVGDYATRMAHYQTRLAHACALSPDDIPALEIVRKMAGTLVHCMEDHGAPPCGPVVKISDLPAVSRRQSVFLPVDVKFGPYKLGAGSLKNLEGVHPDLVWIVHYAIRITEQDFTVTDGVRTDEEQAENVRTGVSQTMKSKHLIQKDGFGHAVDLVPWINGKAQWELLACYKIMEAMRRASFARECLLRWGGAWVPLYNEMPLLAPENLVQAYSTRKRAAGKPAFIDGPHYEMVT